MDSILRQDYPGPIEILVADGMSTDGTREMITGYQANQRNIQLIDNPGKIVPTGLNAALKLAQGDIIIRVDGHTIIAPDYVRRCAETLLSCTADNVGGRMNARGEGIFGETVAIATSSPFGVGGARFHYSEQREWVDTVYMGAWRREAFEKIGLFDEELVRDQDDEFNYRLREHGGTILLDPKIKSVYTNRSSPRALWKQYFQYGFYKIRVLQKHPRQMSLRQFIPPLFVTALIFSLILSLFTPGGWIALLLVGGSYLLANLTTSLITAARKGWRHIIVLPLTFAILHLSYGLGFLNGLLHFWNRWNDKTGKVPAWKPNND